MSAFDFRGFVGAPNRAAVEMLPGRLWSLWDMLKVNASDFCEALLNVHRAQLLVEERNKGSVTYSQPINDDKTIAQLIKRGNKFRHHALNLGAFVTASMVKEHIWTLESKLKPSYEEIVEIYKNMTKTLGHELSTTLLFTIESGKRMYFEPSYPLFGSQFATKFPTSGIFELDEAAKCLALARPTAAVFHLMRLMEVGIQAVARCLKIPDPLKPGDRNWGQILRHMKADLDAHGGQAPMKSWAIPDDKEFFESAYASLDAVRVAWRNTTMHVENKYTDDEAEHIFVAVRDS